MATREIAAACKRLILRDVQGSANDVIGVNGAGMSRARAMFRSETPKYYPASQC